MGDFKAENESLRKQLGALSEERDRLQAQVTALSKLKTLPLSPEDRRDYQRRYDGLVKHAKIGLDEKAELSKLKLSSDPEALAVFKSFEDRVRHEIGWIRDNGAQLMETLGLGGAVFAFSEIQKGAQKR